jgi:uncharacterized protein (TIGR02145 family)
MKKSLFALLVLLLITVTAMCQTKKSLELLKVGMASNDVAKINKALSLGVTVDDCLLEAIVQNKIDYITNFINRGANPSKGLSTAVYRNNLDLVKYLLERGASFSEEYGYIIDGEAFETEIILGGDKIVTPVYSVKVDGYNRLMKKTNNNQFIDVDCGNPNTKYKYKLKKIKAGNRSLIYAIDNNNLQMLNFILMQNVDVKMPCFIIEYKDFTTSEEYVTTNVQPSPPTLMTPLEYALFNNTNKSIVDALLKYDSIPSIKFDIKEVTCTNDNPKVSEMEVIPFDYGFTIKFKLKNENIFAYSLSYRTNDSNFKVIREFFLPIDTTNTISEFNESITHYYCNGFENNNPKELILKISPKEYGTFIDPRDNQQYKTVKIGNHVVMAENLRAKIEKCWAYDNNENNVQKYGYLYSWKASKIAAPKGWHVPSIGEWEDLFEYLVPKNKASYYYRYFLLQDYLGSKGVSGFNMVYGGAQGPYNTYVRMGEFSGFWSSTSDGNKDVCVFFNKNVIAYNLCGNYVHSEPTGQAHSIRLFQDK